MFDDDHEDGNDDHDHRDDDYGDDDDDAHEEGGNGDDDDDGVCSQCGRDDGNPSSWKRPPTRIPPPPSLSVSASRFSSSQERERVLHFKQLVLSCISNNLHFEARHQASGCRGWWRCAASSAGKDWSLVQSQSLLLVSACPPKPGWELHRRDSSPAPP